MKKLIRNISLSLILIFSLIISVANVSAAGGTVDSVLGYVDGDTLHIEGKASGGTEAIAISIYDEAGTSLVAGPETTETNSSWKFSYDFAGGFSADTVYTICAADYDGGSCTPTKTKKLIKEINVTVKNPKAGDEVKEDSSGYGPDVFPETSATSDEYEIFGAWWTSSDGSDLFYGTFEENTDYYAAIDISAMSGYVFTNNTVIKVNGNVTTNNTFWSGGSGLMTIATLRTAEEGDDSEPASTDTASTPDTGTAPTSGDTTDKAIANISIGASIVTASAIVCGIYFIRKKA